jgi:hypothetical protein
MIQSKYLGVKEMVVKVVCSICVIEQGDDDDPLEALPYRELQKLAKREGLARNKSAAELRKRLRAARSQAQKVRPTSTREDSCLTLVALCKIDNVLVMASTFPCFFHE